MSNSIFGIQLALMFLSCATVTMCVVHEQIVHHFLVIMQQTLANPLSKCFYRCPQFMKSHLHKACTSFISHNIHFSQHEHT